jgi:hypothetical protein
VNRYPKGATVTLDRKFYVGSVLTDPTTVTLKVEDPAGTETSYTYAAATITKSGTGIYTKNVACTLAGTWKYRWIGTGAVEAVAEGEFVIKRSVF